MPKQFETAIALALTVGPNTSKEAAVKIVKSGELSRQEKVVLNAIKSHLSFSEYNIFPDDFTAKEINYSRGINYYIIQRRLSGLHDKDKIEPVWQGNKKLRRDGCRVWRLK